METLASIYLTAVTVANFVAPKANLPQVLGVRIAVDSTQSSDVYMKPRDLMMKDASGSATLREQYKEKLTEIRNVRKQKIVEKLDERLTSLLAKWIGHWADALTRLEKILAKVQEKTDRVGEKYDVSEVNTAIAAAEEAIDLAKAELDSVKSKDYVFEISDEANLGYDIRSKISEFKEDMKSVRDAVSRAKDAVHTAISTLNSVIPDQNPSNEEK